LLKIEVMKKFVKTLEFIGNTICGIYLTVCAVAFIVIIQPVFIQLIDENRTFIESVLHHII